ncbi:MULTISPECIES: galactose-1-phosphate uridylyltransferase [Aerosakkonema]|uniref:galactose-1-phosphate uridylyltransferase n=1 Tax=Aerosakkonema TaxID=1246629 RepID=UPI0035B9EE1A
MPELRQNIITRDWVIIATERAKRPHEFAAIRKEASAIPCYKEDCPFCFGNEHRTPEIELLCLSDDRGWRVRVVPNKYPALSCLGERVRKTEGIYRSMSGVGIHEVVIEHPRHDVTIALLSIADVANILNVYRQRYRDIRKDPRIEAIVIFKNHGQEAGTSLEHPHSQITATPIVPSQIRIRIEEAIRFFDDTGECIFCRTLAQELEAGERIVFESKNFVAFIPYAALSPFHVWIFPRRHTSSFEDITDVEILDLAYTLKTVLAKLYYGLNNPDYNYSIRSVPTRDGQTSYFHWYIAIIPRISKSAGFELGSGMYINTAMPEDSAEYLRDVQFVVTDEDANIIKLLTGKEK